MINESHITSGKGGGAVTFTSNFMTLVKKRLTLVTVTQDYDSATTPNQPSLSGCGLTWEVVRTRLNANGNHQRITLFRALGNPTPGQITFAFGGQSQQSFMYTVDQFGGVDLSGINGAPVIVQSNFAELGMSNDNTPLPVSLAAFESPKNATYYTVICPENLLGITLPSGFSALAVEGQDLGPDNGFGAYFKSSPDIAPAVQWSGSGAGVATAIALELKFAEYAGVQII